MYDHPPSEDDRILFPDLRILSCHEMDFDKPVEHAGSTIPLHEALHRALESRVNDLGTALETLRIARCNVLEDWVEGMKDIVDGVDWDEDEGGLAQTDEDEDEDEDEDDPYGYEGYYDYDDYSEDFNSDDEYHMMGLF